MTSITERGAAGAHALAPIEPDGRLPRVGPDQRPGIAGEHEAGTAPPDRPGSPDVRNALSEGEMEGGITRPPAGVRMPLAGQEAADPGEASRRSTEPYPDLGPVVERAARPAGVDGATVFGRVRGGFSLPDLIASLREGRLASAWIPPGVRDWLATAGGFEQPDEQQWARLLPLVGGRADASEVVHLARMLDVDPTALALALGVAQARGTRLEAAYEAVGLAGQVAASKPTIVHTDQYRQARDRLASALRDWIGEYRPQATGDTVPLLPPRHRALEDLVALLREPGVTRRELDAWVETEFAEYVRLAAAYGVAMEAIFDASAQGPDDERKNDEEIARRDAEREKDEEIATRDDADRAALERARLNGVLPTKVTRVGGDDRPTRARATSPPAEGDLPRDEASPRPPEQASRRAMGEIRDRLIPACLEADDPGTQIDLLAQIHWHTVTACQGGSDDAGRPEWLVGALAQALDIALPPLKPGVQAHVEAASAPTPEAYEPRFRELFVEPPAPRGTPRKA